VDRTVLLALRNMVRRPARFFLSVGLLAGAGVVFVAGMSLGDGMAAVADEQSDMRVWDVEVQLADPTGIDDARESLEGLPEVTTVEGLSVANVSLADVGRVPTTRTYPDQGHDRVSVTALPSDSSMFTVPELAAGRWLKEGETGAIVLSESARDDNVPDTQVGDEVQVSINGRATSWQVVGIAEDGSGGTYTTAAGFAEALNQPERVNLLRIATSSHDEGTRTSTATEVEQALTAGGGAVKSAASVSRANASSEGHMGPLVAILLAIAIAMGVVGAIGLASTMSANVLDRTREFGVMHAIGARPKAVRRIVVTEGVFLGLASCLVAILPALGLTALLGAGLGNLFNDGPLPYRISLLAVGIWLALALLGSALATDAAATRASRITVREALAYL
jgi:putative ABC transport system permease protein